MDYTKPHKWFAWHPVIVVDRRPDKPNVHFTVFRFVTRRAVSIGGAVVLGYEISQ